jgi:AcrR family transcriptional regulator
MPSRRYHSPRREAAAAATRQAILDASRELFRAQGYVATTVVQIAAAARVGVNTVYTSTGGKPRILTALATDAVQDPLAEQTIARVAQADDGREAVAIAAAGIREDSEKYADLITIILDTAPADAEAAGVLRFVHEGFREALGAIADRLVELGALRDGLDRASAVDLLWYYFGLASWRVLVQENGWSWNRAESWLSQQATTALIRQAPPAGA